MDLQLLEKKLDNALKKETKKSLKNWLEKKRHIRKIYNYENI